MSLCSRHKHLGKKGLFALKKLKIDPFQLPKFTNIIDISYFFAARPQIWVPDTRKEGFAEEYGRQNQYSFPRKNWRCFWSPRRWACKKGRTPFGCMACHWLIEYQGKEGFFGALPLLLCHSSSIAIMTSSQKSRLSRARSKTRLSH